MTWRSLVFLVAASLFPAALLAQQVKKIPFDEREMHLEELSNLEKENARAIQLNNPSFFQSAYADEFVGATWYGETINKNRLIQLIQNSHIAYSSVAEANIQIKMYLDSASVLSLRSERGTFMGKRLDRQFRVLRVYVYTPRGWKVISQLETQLPSSVTR
ncbi:MAG TPA: nuclear transport factor 2 family protein [Candidatus Acidoferrum sp.]|nr:nuclear transport factor 2 family protein [Candidatus Acidoferrum sp.]